MKWLWPILVGLSLASSAVSLWLWWAASTELQHLKLEVQYPFDARFENAAYGEAARYEAQPVTRMRRYFRPITMTYNRKACVELRPRWGVVGGHTIYCFDLQSGALISKETVRG